MNILLYALIIFLSFGLSYVLKKWFTRLQQFDPINSRSVHVAEATKTGGITAFMTLFIVAVYFYLIKQELFDFSILIPLGIMFIVGIYDDISNADFKIKFLLQIIVAKILIDQGFVIDHFHGVLWLQEIPRLASQIFTVFVFLIIVNAINFIDGIDGMAITETIKVILLVEFFSVERTPLYYLGVIVALSLIPLYYFNFKKNNKVFLGDAGSLFLGTLIAAYLFYVLGPDYTFKEAFRINKPLLTMSVIIYPLTDLLRVFIIRIYNKKSPFSPDQNHLHHLLLKKGYSHKQVIVLIQAGAIIFLTLAELIA